MLSLFCPVEAVVFFMCATLVSALSIEYQYIYQFVSREHNVTSDQFLNYCEDNSTERKDRQLVAGIAAKWTMGSQVAGFIVKSVSSFFLVSCSDVIGRKRAMAFPLVGNLLNTTLQAIIILFRLPIYWILVSSVLKGCFGGYHSMLDISTAYLSDTVPNEDRGKRYTILEVSAALGGAVSVLSVGYWIKLHGFIPPSFFLVGISVFALVLLTLVEESQVSRNSRNDANTDPETERLCLDIDTEDEKNRRDVSKSKLFAWKAQAKKVWLIYTTENSKCDICDEENQNLKNCVHGGGERKGRVWRLWFYVLSFAIYEFCFNGVEVFQTMFFLSPPICFTPDLIGARDGFESSTVLVSLLFVLLYENVLHMNGQTILLTGILGRLSSYLIMYFAHDTTLVFLATSLVIFGSVTTPYLRSGISSLVSTSEQGSVFALQTSVNCAVSIFAPIVVLSIYPATLRISYSYIWLMKTFIMCIPLTLMTIMWTANFCRKRHVSHGEK